MPNDHSEMRRLEIALQIWVDYQESDSGESAEQLLSRHEDVRDLLTPLLAGESRLDAEDTAPSDEGLPFADCPLFRPGSEFDDYQVVRGIGRGGMGIVVAAWQKSLDRHVALKALAPHIANQPKSIARFKREALTAARLDHPAIIDVFAVGHTDGVEWFSMELVDGPALNDHANTLRELNPDTYLQKIISVMVEVCRALDHAHSAGVVHRDLKPSNILIRADGSPVVTDFGLSRELDLPSITQTSEFAGTPYYVSPEQIQGGPALIGPRSDVFALGVTIYELTTAERPFQGASTQAVFDKVLHQDPIPPDVRAPEIPRDLAAVIEKALEKKPEDRYPTAGALADDLDRFLQDREVRARHLGRVGRAVRWVRRHPSRLAAASAISGALAITTVLTLYVWWTGGATLAGRKALDTDRLETLLLEATYAPYEMPENTTGRDPTLVKQRLIDEAMQLGGDDPYVVFRVVHAFAKRGGSKKVQESTRSALAVLDNSPARVRDDPALLRLRLMLLRRAARDEEADALTPRVGEPETPLDLYAASEVAMARLHHLPPDANDPETRAEIDQVIRHARAAVAMSSTPRSEFLLQLKRAAILGGDKETELIAVDALARRWPKCAATWAHKAMSYSGVDDDVAAAAAEESLRLRPDNYFGLIVQAQIAKREGDAATADEIVERAGKLYPRAIRFERLASNH